MTTPQFFKQYRPCQEGREFALQFETMSEVWDACERTEWIFWILEKHAPLAKEQSVRLAIAFAESCIDLYTGPSAAPREAIQAAKNYLENPSEENRLAAWSAAESAESAESADKQNCNRIREFIKNPFLP